MPFGRFKFYDIQSLFANYPKAQYYMVIGERSNGKTYSSLRFALDNYFRKGEQFAYIRRLAEDTKKKHMETLFSPMREDGTITKLTSGEWDYIDFQSAKFIPRKMIEDRVVSADEPIGYAFDLSTMERYKSTSFPKITTIIFDEFLSRTAYLPNEFILFTNVLSTIIRHRNNVRIIMLGNTVNRYCPYFEEMGLSHVKDQKQGTIDVYTYGQSDLQVVVEYCESSKKRGGKQSDIYFAFDNPRLQMITEGSWELAIYPHLTERYLPKEVCNYFFVEFDKDVLCGEIVVQSSGMYTFLHRQTRPIRDEDGVLLKKYSDSVVYTTRPSTIWNERMCLTKQHDKLSRAIMLMLTENNFFYSTNEVGEIFRNYIIWSNNYDMRKS